MTTLEPIPLAARVQLLFDAVRRENRGQTDEEVARATGLEADYITALRTGARSDASDKDLASIARHFLIDPQYLSGSSEDQHNWHSQLLVYRDAAAGDMSMFALRARSQGLSTDAAAELSKLINDTNARYGTR